MPHPDNERLTAYLDGELTEAEVATLEDELSSNPDLLDMLNELRVVRDLMRRVGPQDAPQTLYDRVMSAVDVEAAHRRGSFIPAGLGAPVAMILVAASFLLFMNEILSSKALMAQIAGAPPEATAPVQAGDVSGPVKVEVPPEMTPRPPVDLSQLPPQAYNLAPVAYRVSGPGALAVLQATAASVGARLVDGAGADAAAPDAKGELWLDIDADQVRAFRHTLEGQVRIQAIGMPVMIQDRAKLRLILEDGS